MSDNQNQQQQGDGKKHDPAVALQKIKDFLGRDVTAKPKLTRDVLDELLGEMSEEAEEKLKTEVKEELKGIIADNQQLKKAEQDFQKVKNEVGKKLNERLGKLAGKVERHTQEKKELGDTLRDLDRATASGVLPAHLEGTTVTETTKTTTVDHTFNTDGQS